MGLCFTATPLLFCCHLPTCRQLPLRSLHGAPDDASAATCPAPTGACGSGGVPQLICWWQPPPPASALHPRTCSSAWTNPSMSCQHACLRSCPQKRLKLPWEPVLTKEELRRGETYYGSGGRLNRLANKLLAGKPIKVYTLGGRCTCLPACLPACLLGAALGPMRSALAGPGRSSARLACGVSPLLLLACAHVLLAMPSCVHCCARCWGLQRDGRRRGQQEGRQLCGPLLQLHTAGLPAQASLPSRAMRSTMSRVGRSVRPWVAARWPGRC